MRFLPAENKRLPSALTPRPHLQLAQGDLVMTRAGPRTRAGVTCLVRQSRSRLILCDKAYLIRGKDDRVLPAYLEVCLNAPHIVDALDALKTGISDSGVNLTQARLRELVIPLPPLAEQHVIVEAVEDHLSVIEHLEADLEAKLKSAQALRQSILRHAFTGQLVPQDPNDEPAELLKRIAAERVERARETTVAKRPHLRVRGSGRKKKSSRGA
jgi:type I restriction enzyme S subunit